nr:unnamed protein product [Spirometra erinaceieuropaei]
MEKIIKKALIQFLEQNHLLSDAQHGFRSDQELLTELSQIVQVGRQQSSEVNVVSGVPQGSVLGPTLFLAFLNVCVKDLDCDAILFVDGIKSWEVIHNATDGYHLQLNLNGLEDWPKHWLMAVNVNMCNFLQLGSCRASSPKACFLYDTQLQQVVSLNDLGVRITSSLKPKLH